MMTLILVAALLDAPSVAPANARPLAPYASEDEDGECSRCEHGKICREHAAADKAAIKALRPELESEEKVIRIKALQRVAALVDDHEGAPSKEAAKVLAAALKDDQLVVQEAAVRLLSSDQDPEIAVTGTIELIEFFEKNMWSLVADMTGPNEEHGTVVEAMSLIETTMRCASDLRDDRVVAALVDVLGAYPAEMRGEPVAMATCRSLLDMGTQSAAAAVIKQFDTRPDEAKARKVHFALRSFALDLEIEDLPSFGPKAGKDWEAWFRKNRRSIPKKLGRWTGPPPEDEEDEGDD